MKRTYWYLLIITLVASVLRLITLAKESIWLDEAFSVLYASQSWQQILTNYATDVHPPLFYLIQHIFYINGTSEFAIRLFPALCGILCIPVVYLIGKEALDENSGLLMAAMVCLSEFAIMYSMEARMYTLLLLFTSSALYFWLRFQKDQSRTNIILFSVFSALACWSHFFGIIPFLVLVLLLPRAIDIAESTVLTGLLCLPMLPAVIEMASYQLSVTLTGLTGMSVITGTLWVIGGFYPVGMYVLTMLSFLGMIVLWKYKDVTT